MFFYSRSTFFYSRSIFFYSQRPKKWAGGSMMMSCMSVDMIRDNDNIKLRSGWVVANYGASGERRPDPRAVDECTADG